MRHRRQRERGLHELYQQDPERADAEIWGRRWQTTRRGLLEQSTWIAAGAWLGSWFPVSAKYPFGLIPAALADNPDPFVIPGKSAGLEILNDRPINAETPAHLLDGDFTANEFFFVRNNGRMPESIDPTTWTLTLDGEALPRKVTFSLRDLQTRFAHHSYALVLECGGNGRKEFSPPAKGNQWTTGAVGCALFTGVRLRDVLKAAGVQPNAVYVGYYGADVHLSGDPNKTVISRGVPIAKAMQDETLLAWEMNGVPLPKAHGAPLRLVAGGWPASTSGKWLTRLSVRDRIHDGPKMGGSSYRVPCTPARPGENVPDEKMCIIESMPVRSLITSPRSGIVHGLSSPLQIQGHAWAGELGVREVWTSIDFGATWQKATLAKPRNRLAWQRFRTEVRFAAAGYYEIWARAVDDQGRSQPMVVPGWNPKGYLNNACHRIAVQVS